MTYYKSQSKINTKSEKKNEKENASLPRITFYALTVSIAVLPKLLLQRVRMQNGNLPTVGFTRFDFMHRALPKLESALVSVV